MEWASGSLQTLQVFGICYLDIARIALNDTDWCVRQIGEHNADIVRRHEVRVLKGKVEGLGESATAETLWSLNVAKQFSLRYADYLSLLVYLNDGVGSRYCHVNGLVGIESLYAVGDDALRNEWTDAVVDKYAILVVGVGTKG